MMHQLLNQDCMNGARHHLPVPLAREAESGAGDRFRKNKVELIVCDTELLPTRKQS